MRWKLFADLAEAAGDDTVEVDPAGETVGDALDALLDARPELADRACDEAGHLRDHVNLLHEGETVATTASGLERTVEDGDELALYPPVTGG